jgi:predicted ABC-class ATPase
MNLQQLNTKMENIDSKDYGLYQSLKGTYDFPFFKLIIEQIPKDPYAPSHTGIYRIITKRNDERIINWEIKHKITQIAFCDYIARRFHYISALNSRTHRGTGNSGLITINPVEQAILERNNVLVSEENIEIRCFLGLPANGRKIDAPTAQKMLLHELPEIVGQTLFVHKNNPHSLKRHIETAEDADFLRKQLPKLNLIAFIANNSVLPRASGLSDKPASQKNIIPFQSPKNMETTIMLPHHGQISGMGIHKGVTLIVGGGFHGKSTLLECIENGIYNHIPGDGREFCVSLTRTVKIRAYNGRSICKTDISPFINNLPFGADTKTFSSKNASGSTSQAAAIIESIESAVNVLLMDEDTCAANFMIRDDKMQQLVNKTDEPITPFIERIRELYLQKDISTILVLGGSGDYFGVSDSVIQMLNYRALNVTDKAHKILHKNLSPEKGNKQPFINISKRIPLPEGIDANNYYKKKRIIAKDIKTITFGNEQIDLTDIEQLVELSQVKALGFAIDYAKKYMNGKRSLPEIIKQVTEDIEKHGLDILITRKSGEFAIFRDIDLIAAVNRIRGLKIK